jgi:glycerophosphoryl diester phosphodiesterase
MADRWLSSVEQIRTLAKFATGIGPAKRLIAGRPDVVRHAHEAGLTVTPYTFRSADTGEFPDVTAEMEHFIYTLGVDALFTDHPDRFPRQ